ncbi:response regulator transcription factor [Aureibacter tunicatorum]|uniref:DNA-binding CsgD family transcriptional regulator n=1 Tax=Aureibacter tunicatorum TaxID=866807 RepID=A0AAE3XM46_9BACT|nr:helix-turn-helix transcriptional regulator [Aureibacter tunicatorum]MDR6238484.1 DNA-binding CsgD family transcriptional regulator [Aureibacter tunicatorum]BDD05583.1 hypothetical protein AUTU_30660 [Aureibacter tunicatorum]
MEKIYYKHFFDLNNAKYDFEEAPYEEIEKHIQNIQQMESLLPASQSFYMLIDMGRKNIPYVSSNIKHCLSINTDNLKIPGTEEWIKNVFAEDRLPWIELVEKLYEKAKETVPASQYMNCAYTWNYRFNSSGKTFNLISHYTPLILNANNEHVLGLSHISILDVKFFKEVSGSLMCLNEHNAYETLCLISNPQVIDFKSLTNREKIIVKCLACGESAQDISDKLHISIHTVYTHCKNIYKKLEINSSGELVSFYKNNPFCFEDLGN